MPKLKVGDELIVDIITVDAEGRGVGKYYDRPVIIPDTAPGTRVRARITSVRTVSYLAEVMEQITEDS